VQIIGASRSQIEQESMLGCVNQMRRGGVLRLDERTVRCRVLDSFDMFVDVGERSVGGCLLNNGCWEPWITRAIASHLRPGMTVVDVGAQLGYYAALASWIVGESGLVVAVEPHDRMRELCGRTLAHNAFSRFVVDSRAAWDEDGACLELSTPGSLVGSSSLIGHGPPPDGELVTKQPVETLRLDRLLSGLGVGSVDFVKVDCEGAEPRIWRGMREVWERSPGIVVCAECAPTPEGRRLVEVTRADGARVRVVDYSGEIVELEEQHLEHLVMLWITKA
jgi:FkbM family methyltransferase